MLNLSKINLRSLFLRFRDYYGFLQRTGWYTSSEIAILLALAIAFYFYGHHLFNQTVPVDSDVRAHLFKIEILQSYLSHFSWPQWISYWYQGLPIDQYYPPGFYFLGAILTFIFRQAVVAYKVLLLLTLMLDGLAIYYFSRRFLKFDSHMAIWCLLAYETSTPMLVDFTYGEGPNLLGWSISVFFLTIYLSRLIENKTRGLFNIILPGFLLGIAILIHPFPIVFIAIAVAAFHILLILYERSLKTFIHSQLLFMISVVLIGALISIYYWLPAVLTLNYSGSIYSFLQYAWPGGAIYLLIIVFTASLVGLITRNKIAADSKLDFIIVCLYLAAILGFGATIYLPFNIGDLIQSFRFATMVVPFFGILLTMFPLKYNLTNFNLRKIALAHVLGVIITLLAFGMDKREAIISGLQTFSPLNIGGIYGVFAKQFSGTFLNFAIFTFPFIILSLYLAFSITDKPLPVVRGKLAFVLAAGICLTVITSVSPYIGTDKQFNLNRLYTYVENYRTPEYAQILNSVKDSRLIVPLYRGGLMEGDSPVTFGWQWGVETVNGPYNQGDPKFFKFTVHLEWEQRWLKNGFTRENLMQESGAKYVFIRNPYPLFANLNGLSINTSNRFGKLLELNQSVSRATKVTPILMDVGNPQAVTEFFNILIPGGYKMVLVNIHDIEPALVSRFAYIMVDDISKISNYPGQNIFLLTDTPNLAVTETQNLIHFNLPYLTYTNRLFYHGRNADDYMWKIYDQSQEAQINPTQQKVIQRTSQLIAQYLDRMDYVSAGYKSADNRIDLSTSSGFTLVKDSYFPYWQTVQGDLIPTSQGFILVYSGANNLILNYQLPLYYKFAAICSIFCLIIITIFLLGTFFSFRIRRP